MAAETQYTANTGIGVISSANSALDGTSAVTVLTASSAAGMLGCIVKSVTVKATGNTTQGMVRLFISGGGAIELIAEIEVPAVTKSATAPSFEIYLQTNYALKAGYILKATTQNAETFNVIAEGLDWKYYTTSVRPESTKYTANTGIGQVATANSNLDGTGDIQPVLTAASNGTDIKNVSIKSIVNVTAGMIRLYIYNGSTSYLFTEVRVNAVTKSSTYASFSSKVLFDGIGFALQTGYILKASTQNGETFNVIGQGLDWSYPA